MTEIAISILLFIVSIYIYRKTNPTKTNKSCFSAAVFLVITLYLIYFVSDYFTGQGLDDSVMYHIRYGLGGAGFLEYWKLITVSVVSIAIGVIFVWRMSPKNTKKRGGTAFSYAAYLFLLASLICNPAITDLYDLFSPKLQVSNFEDFYKQPSITKVNDTKNLVVIYAESLERTYFDEDIFPGLIKGLRKLESRSTYFTNIKQVPRTHFTIAGFVASQCGIPLFTSSHGNSMSGMDKYLPSAIGMGDLLHQEGYYLAYYGGADLDFAGKGKFLSTHGFDEIQGKDELLHELENPSYLNNWGLYDDSLFDIAYKRFIELSGSQENFGLVMLTLDTHHPNGHLSNSVKNIKYNDGQNPMLNAVAGSDYLISKFINNILESQYASKTVIVVVSDHLAQKSAANKLLKKGIRNNLFMIIEPKVTEKTEINTPGSTLDIGTTILPFIGYEGTIGLGRNLTKPDVSVSEIETIHNSITSWKLPVSRFWDFPQIKNLFEINLADQTINIDGRIFSIPVLVELDEELQSTLKFQFSSETRSKLLVDHVLELDENTSFILLDESQNIERLNTASRQTSGQTGFSMVVGKGHTNYQLIKLKEKITLTANDLRRLLGYPQEFRPLRIAHAGGGIGGVTVTNSRQALDHNLKKGFRYFELDFSFTKDGHLVCIHDFKKNFEKLFGFTLIESPTLKTFKTFLDNKSGPKNLTLDCLISWLDQNQSAFIITDVKNDNLKALELISQKVPDFEKKVIPQIYNPANYNKVKDMGYQQIIWTLYRYKGTDADVLKWADEFHGPFAITMPKTRAESNLPKQLAEKNISTYVHTVNSAEEADFFLDNFGVTEIYTDFLPTQ